MQVQSLASLGGLRIQCCRELWCRSQTWLSSGVAMVVVQAGSCSSDSSPSLGTSIATGVALKRQKNKTKQKKTPAWFRSVIGSSLGGAVVNESDWEP